MLYHYDATISNDTLRFGQLDGVCAFHPTLPMFASGSFDETVVVYDTSNWSIAKSLTDSTNGVIDLAFHPSLPLLASGSHDSQVRIYD